MGVVMLAFSDLDYVPLQQFSLRWRFTDRRCNQLSEAELAQIRPLSLSASGSVHRVIMSFVGDDKSPFPARGFGNVTQCDTSGDAQVGRFWLEGVLPSAENQVLVSWDANVAVVTMLSLFTRFWDDFCYPGSDDTTIVPFDLSWIVQYRHWEALFFATRIQSSLADGSVAGPGVAPGDQSL